MILTNTVNNRQLLKTLWEKEKLLLTPFPAMFSTQSDDCIPFVHDFDIISFCAVESEELEVGLLYKGLKGCKYEVSYQ